MTFSGAILLSRQSLCPCCKDLWVRRSMAAVEWFKRHDLTLCSSVGMPTWDLLTSLASMHGIKLKLIVPVSETAGLENAINDIGHQFGLTPDLTSFEALLPVSTSSGRNSALFPRDEAVMAAADLLVPISIRPKGTLEMLLEKARQQGKTMMDEFQIPYVNRRAPLAYTIDADNLNPELSTLPDNYLFHWTRTSLSAWPDETMISYYRAVVSSDSYPRSALDSLKNIISTGVLRASSRNIAAKMSVVSFSDSRPGDMAALMRWRARRRGMSFEPYGLGIEKDLADRLGIQPVTYYESLNGSTPAIERWLTQSRGIKSDWSREREYRHPGDLSLKRVPRDRMVLICRTVSEAQQLALATEIRTIPFEIN